MSDRNKVIVLLVLLGVFFAVNFRHYFFPSTGGAVVRTQQALGKPGARIPDAEVVDPIDPSAPSVVVEAKRNIFQYGQPAQPVNPRPKPVEVVDTSPPPPPPPPKAPVRFFGFAQGSAGGARRVFLTNGEDTFIVREGDVFMQRYRLLRVTATNIEIEQVGGEHRWTVPIEQP